MLEHQDRWYSVSGSTWEQLTERDGIDELLHASIPESAKSEF